MLSILAKLVLVSTSLAPVLIAIAINQYENDKPWTYWILWIIAAVVLICLCSFILNYLVNNAQKCKLFIKEFEPKNHEVLTFLFIYLLPFLRLDSSIVFCNWLSTIYIYAVIIFALVITGSFHFNPVMRILFRYRFYAVKDQLGVTNLLISKKDLNRPNVKINTVLLAPNVFLHLDDQNV